MSDPTDSTPPLASSPQQAFSLAPLPPSLPTRSATLAARGFHPQQGHAHGTPAPGIRWVTNGFLFLFTVEALWSLAACFPGWQRIVPGLSTGRDLLSLTVTLLFILQIFLISSYRFLPWIEMGPALALTCWSRFLYLPLPGILAWHNVEFVGALLQTAGALANLAWIWGRWKSLGFPAEAFADASFSMARTCKALALKLLFFLPAALAYVAVSCALMLEWRSEGFIKLRPRGLYVESRIYQRDQKFVHLLPTVHIASPDFYNQLFEGTPKAKSRLLPEGVSDRKSLLKHRLSYAAAAKAAGLSEQPRFAGKIPSDVFLCDADLSEFSESTLLALNTVTLAMKYFEDQEAMSAYTTLSGFHPDLPQLKRDLLDLRNRKVFTAIQESLPRFDHILVPWGAAHMPGIEESLLQHQFQKVSTRRLAVVTWSQWKLLAHSDE